MASEYASTLANVNVQQPAGVIHGSRNHIVSAVIDIDTPNRLAVIFKSKRASSVDEIPDFNG